MAFQYILCDTMHRLSIEGLLQLLQQRKDCFAVAAAWFTTTNSQSGCDVGYSNFIFRQ